MDFKCIEYGIRKFITFSHIVQPIELDSFGIDSILTDKTIIIIQISNCTSHTRLNEKEGYAIMTRIISLFIDHKYFLLEVITLKSAISYRLEGNKFYLIPIDLYVWYL